MENSDKNKKRIGLLALQGAYFAHERVLKSLDVRTSLIRYPRELDDITALVVPGGESTTMLKLLEPDCFGELLIERVRGGMAYFGTCAGAILAAREVTGPAQASLGLIDITVERNAYGRQVDSFCADFPIPSLGLRNFHGIFIRSPIITRIGPGVETLAEHKGRPVLVRLGNILLATFHPELSGSDAVHRFFIQMISGPG